MNIQEKKRDEARNYLKSCRKGDLIGNAIKLHLIIFFEKVSHESIGTTPQEVEQFLTLEKKACLIKIIETYRNGGFPLLYPDVMKRRIIREGFTLEQLGTSEEEIDGFAKK